VDEGTAAWVEGELADVNFTTSETVWYMVAFRSIAQRNATPPYPTFHVLYASPDLTAPPSGKNLVHQLGMITMDAGGRTSAHSHGGTEAFYVMKGTVQLAVAGVSITYGSSRGAVSGDDGAYLIPNLPRAARLRTNKPGYQPANPSAEAAEIRLVPGSLTLQVNEDGTTDTRVPGVEVRQGTQVLAKCTADPC